ncbi:MAG TPA: hypothetical protein VI432_03100, partial [Candidatus Paceibacterota bacterium]
MRLGTITEDKLKDILIEGGYVDKADLTESVKVAEKESLPLISVLLRRNLTTQKLIGQVIAEFYNLPYADLAARPPEKEMINIIPEDFAKNNRVVLLGVEGDKVNVATDSPDRENLRQDLKKEIFDIFIKRKQLASLGQEEGFEIIVPQAPEFNIFYALPDNIDSVFSQYRKALETKFVEII